MDLPTDVREDIEVGMPRGNFGESQIVSSVDPYDVYALTVSLLFRVKAKFHRHRRFVTQNIVWTLLWRPIPPVFNLSCRPSGEVFNVSACQYAIHLNVQESECRQRRARVVST